MGKCSQIVFLKECAVGFTFYLYTDALFACICGVSQVPVLFCVRQTICYNNDKNSLGESYLLITVINDSTVSENKR